MKQASLARREALLFNAHNLRKNKFLVEAIDEYSKALKIGQPSSDIYKGLAFCYRDCGELFKAIEYFKNALALQAFDAELRLELAKLYLYTEKAEKAAHELKLAIRVNPNCISSKFNLAIAHEYMGEHDMAVMICKKILEDHPYYIPAIEKLGNLSLHEGNYVEALKFFKQILTIDKKSSKAFIGKALAFDKLDKKHLAIRWYKKYLKLRPNSIKTSYIENRICELGSSTAKNNHLRVV